VFNKGFKLFYITTLLFFSLLHIKVSAQEYSENVKSISLIKDKISYYIDSANKLSLNDIRGKKFSVLKNEIFNYYHTHDKIIWIHFGLKNNSSLPTLYINIDYSLIDKITLYSFKDGLLVDSAVEGFNGNGNKQRPFFNLNLKPGESREYFLKAESEAPFFLPLQIGSYSSFQRKFQTRDAFTGLYLGIMFALFFYNAVIYFFVKDKSYIYYVIYTLFMALTQITILGYAWRFIDFGNAWLDHLIIILFPCLAGYFVIMFARTFMNLKSFFPIADRLFDIFILVYAAAAVLMAFNKYSISYRIIDTNVLILSVYALVVSILAVKKGSRPAIFFLIAWVILIICLVIYSLRNFEVLPYERVSSYLLYMGSAVQTVLLSIALADKINIYKKETELSQARALSVSLENEKLVKEQNVRLEEEVSNRTQELQNTNLQLSEALDNLKDTQTQLVEAEKMASLGQLTAGIAHEINNPINFVKSNINPLRLDVKDLMEILNAYDELHTIQDLNAYKQKLGAIEELKTGMDVTYLQKEIDSLILGIEEGAERTAEIVRGLRTFSRIDEAALKTVNIHDGILSTLVLLKNNFPYYINLVKEFNANGNIECFPGKLNQVFMNVITNAIQAIKAKPVKEDEETIVIKTRDIENDQIEISIKDSGVGMTDEIKHHIFEPFFTTKEIGEGTGLGMAIVFKIIQKHSGKISIISSPNEGAEFIITLPNHQDSD